MAKKQRTTTAAPELSSAIEADLPPKSWATMLGLGQIEQRLESVQRDVGNIREDVAYIKGQNEGQGKSISDISQKVDKLQRYFWIAVGILAALTVIAKILLPDIDITVTVPTTKE